jgi:hypothetical protein
MNRDGAVSSAVSPPHGAAAPAVRAVDRDDDSLYKNVNPNRITTSTPEEGHRLGVFDVMCLVFNRMIGRSVCCLAL